MMSLTTYTDLLDKNTQALFARVSGYSATALVAKVSERWSAMEILEHLYLTDGVVASIIKRPSSHVHTNEFLLGEEKLKKYVAGENRKKVKNPPMLTPQGNMTNLEQFKKAYTTQRENIKRELAQGLIVVDNRLHAHPMLGEMTIADWLYFMIVHTERHFIQLDEALQGKIK